MLDFEVAISELKDGKDELAQAKLSLFINSNRNFLQQTFENKDIRGIPVRLGDDIGNYGIYALGVVEELRKIKSHILSKIDLR